ncbi:hypothetical protein EDC94DRAFT_664244 [Helicostylum pulchrum]|nr:hypothetical protein EDC94DRAFT_664244 [Helicostylum pulchrum]
MSVCVSIMTLREVTLDITRLIKEMKRKRKEEDELFFDQDYRFELDDLKGITDPVDDLFDVFGLDPGRGQVFQAASDDLRRISTKEY